MVTFDEQKKAVAGFITGVIGVVVTRAATGEAPLPSVAPFDLGGWALVIGVAVLVYLGVFVPPNRLNASQVDKGLAKLPTVQQELIVAKHAPPVT